MNMIEEYNWYRTFMQGVIQIAKEEKLIKERMVSGGVNIEDVEYITIDDLKKADKIYEDRLLGTSLAVWRKMNEVNK